MVAIVPVTDNIDDVRYGLQSDHLHRAIYKQ
jgi:hypothetical protein